MDNINKNTRINDYNEDLITYKCKKNIIINNLNNLDINKIKYSEKNSKEILISVDTKLQTSNNCYMQNECYNAELIEEIINNEENNEFIVYSTPKSSRNQIEAYESNRCSFTNSSTESCEESFSILNDEKQINNYHGEINSTTTRITNNNHDNLFYEVKDNKSTLKKNKIKQSLHKIEPVTITWSNLNFSIKKKKINTTEIYHDIFTYITIICNW